MEINIEEIKRENLNNKYVSFEVSSLPSSIYNEFSIKTDERIIAYVMRKKLGFFKNYVLVVTNKAMYTKLSKKRENNRISYETICSYIAISKDTQFLCLLMNEVENIPVLDMKFVDVFAHNNYGEELTEFIRKIQLQLIKVNEICLKQREAAVLWAEGVADEEFKKGDLLNNKLYVIEELHKEPLYYKKMSIILGRNYIRSGSIDEFEKFLFSIENKEGYEEIINAVKKDIDQFKNDSIDSCRTFYPYFIERINKNIEKSLSDLEESTNKNKVVYKYIDMLKYIKIAFKIRDNQFMSDNDVISLCSDNKDVSELLKFKKLLSNSLMSELVSNIINNNFVLDKKYVDYIDANGFSALYYVLILKNKEAITYFLNNIKELPELPIDVVDELYIKFFDYSFIAMYLGYTDIAMEIIDKSAEIVALKKSKKSLETMLKMKNVKIATMEKAVNKAKNLVERIKSNGEYDVDRINDLYEKIQNYKDDIRFEKETIRDLECDIKEIDTEIHRSKNRCYERNMIWMEEINKNEGDVLYEYIKTLFSKDKIIAFLNLSKEEVEIIECNGKYYFISKELLGYYKTTRQKENKKYNKQSYKKSSEKKEKTKEVWFSDEAHGSIDILRKEYRKLAKKYHPDVNPLYEREFKEINKQREEILRKLSNE